jgi:hypothetical protein
MLFLEEETNPSVSKDKGTCTASEKRGTGTFGRGHLMNAAKPAAAYQVPKAISPVR